MRIDFILGSNEAGIMTDGNEADTYFRKVSIESILCRDLIDLESRQLERLLCNLIDTAISSLSFHIDV